MEKPAKILIIRNDRIGDLVLTLPALEVLRRKFPEAEISLMCSEYASPIVRGNPNINRLLTGKPAHDESDFSDVLQDIKNLGVDAAVTMVHSWKKPQTAQGSRNSTEDRPLGQAERTPCI